MTDLESALARAIVDLEVARERLAVAERERVAFLRIAKRGGDWVAHVGGAVVGPFATPAEAMRRVIDNACMVAKEAMED